MSSKAHQYSPSFNPDLLVQFALLALALLGFFGVLIATRWGAGTSPDSIVYIAGARNLATGRGFSLFSDNGAAEPITHHAPLYSIALAIFDLGGMDPLQAARWLNALLFAGNILLVGFVLLDLMQDQSAEARLAPVIGAGLMLSSLVWVEIHTMAWSESLFIFLTLSGFWALSRFLSRPSAGYLIGSAALIALAWLTRYIGVVLVATAGLSILLFSTRSLRRRITVAVLFALISAGPMVLWLLRNSLVGGTATSRELFFHPINRQQVGWALTTLGSWFMIPDNSSGLIKVLPYLAMGLMIAVVLITKQKHSQRSKEWTGWVTLSALPLLIRIIMIFIPLYLAFLLVSLTFLDANTPLDSRIFSPIYATGVILVTYFFVEGLEGLRKAAFVRYILIGIVLAFIVALAFTSIAYIQNGYADGIGFTSRWWRESPTLAALRNYPADQVVYTNAPEALYLYTQRSARVLPKKYESANQRPNDNYDQELIQLKEQILDEGGIIVYFDPLIRSTLPSANEILEILELKVLEQTADGVIYGIREQNSTRTWQPSV
jgi:hypothetical protein